jgi:large subunit ribosomal protein L23
MNIYDIIVRPLETEKAYALRNQQKYVFVVNMNANKLEIKRAVEEIYSVDVDRVRTMVVAGKVNKMRGRRIVHRRSPWKKAVVTLAAGERIEALEA